MSWSIDLDTNQFFHINVSYDTCTSIRDISHDSHMTHVRVSGVRESLWLSHLFRSIIVFGATYFILSAIFSGIRMIGFRLYSPHTIIGWFAPSNITNDIVKDLNT